MKMSILVDKILSTENSSVHQIFETKGKVYTYLNPVSYLTALDNKELFGKMDGIFADGGLLVAFNEFWFVLRIDTIRYILSFLKQHPEVLEFYQYIHIPDETMFGSILCADEVHKKALRSMCHLIDWNTNQYGSPKTFTLEDINYITTSCENNPNLLFASKFNEDDKILDLLDKK